MSKRKKKCGGRVMRSAPLSLRMENGAPTSLDEDGRSVEVVAATESPVRVIDWSTFELVDEVLLMSGCRMPTKQLPLLDSHSRYSTSSVIGSFREIRKENDQLVGRAVFSKLEEGDRPFTKVREGHLTDFSIGYEIHKKQRVGEGETATIGGRTFDGPVVVVRDWSPRELSICPIGADQNAKARADYQEEDEMNERLRKFLESRGLVPDASEDEAWRFLEGLGGKDDVVDARQEKEQLPVDAERNDPDLKAVADKAAAEALAAERFRCAEIQAMGRRFDCSDLAESMITDSTTVDEARVKILDAVEARHTDRDIAHYSVGTSDKEKYRSAAEDALRMRAGLVVEKPAPGADELRSLTLRELARDFLVRSGVRVPGNVLDLTGRALTSSDFPELLAATANKSLLEAYEGAEETWQEWCSEGSLPDFKSMTLLRAGEFDDLEEIGELEEYKHGTIPEAKEIAQLATYGKKFGISRQAIINDDLGALTEIPAKMGEAAARKIADLPYAVLTANVVMADGKALFHAATHKNLADSGAVISADTLGPAFQAMALQKDLGGKRRLNIRPLFVIAPVSLMGAAETFFQTDRIKDTAANEEKRNIYSGTLLKRVYEARLDDDDSAAWYLAGRKGMTVKVYFLDGNKQPYLEQKAGWSVDGAEYKVRIDAAAKAMDYRALYKNPGA